MWKSTSESGYFKFPQAAFPHLADLVSSCRNPEAPGYCENYLLFAIEKQILHAFPKERRFVTLGVKGEEHNPVTLYSKFGKECRPG